MEKCNDHSGCVADIKNLKTTDRDQWAAINIMGDKIDKFSARLNMILSGVVVTAISALLTLAIMFVTKAG